MTLRDELEKLDLAVCNGEQYGFDQTIWGRMLTTLDCVDALGLAIADAGYVWTPEMREAYEQATGLYGDATEQLNLKGWLPKGYHMRGKG
jgi:hypothetical protein